MVISFPSNKFAVASIMWSGIPSECPLCLISSLSTLYAPFRFSVAHVTKWFMLSTSPHSGQLFVGRCPVIRRWHIVGWCPHNSRSTAGLFSAFNARAWFGQSIWSKTSPVSFSFAAIFGAYFFWRGLPGTLSLPVLRQSLTSLLPLPFCPVSRFHSWFGSRPSAFSRIPCRIVRLLSPAG